MARGNLYAMRRADSMDYSWDSDLEEKYHADCVVSFLENEIAEYKAEHKHPEPVEYVDQLPKENCIFTIDINDEKVKEFYSDFIDFFDYSPDFSAEYPPDNLIGVEMDYADELEVERWQDDLENALKFIDADIIRIGKNFFFRITEVGKKKWFFRTNFTQFRELVKHMSLDDFMDSDFTYRLENAISYKHGNAVYWCEGDGFQKFDDAMRDFVPGDWYLVDYAILMH